MRDNRQRKNSPSLGRAASARPLALLVGLALLNGCSRAPTFSFLGSFFPAWLICMVAGIIVSAAANRLLAYLKIDKEIVWSILVYPCLAVFFACFFWLIFFS